MIEKSTHKTKKWSLPHPMQLIIVLIMILSSSLILANCSQENPTQEDAVDALITDLNDPDDTIRRHAADALGEIGDDRAVDALVAALNDSERSVRRQAAQALGKIGDPRAVDPLIMVWKQDLVDDSVVDVLVNIGDPRVVEVAVIAGCSKPFAQEIIRDFGTGAAEVWISLLSNESETIRSQAVHCLYETEIIETIVGDDATMVVNSLIEIIPEMEDDQWRNTQELSRALLERLGPSAVGPLIAALEGEDESLWFPAAYSLGKIGGAEAAEALVSALESSDQMKSLAGLWGLKEWQWWVESEKDIVPLERGLDKLILYVQDLNLNWFARFYAAGLLARISDPRSVQALVDALENAGDLEITPMYAIMDALGELGDPAAIPALMDILENESDALGADAVEAMAKIGGAEILPILINALQDGGMEVQKAALDSLNGMGDEALASLLDAIAAEDIEIIARAHLFFISRGEAATEGLLVQALMDYGTKGMMITYLNSGNERLEDAARIWAEENGYLVIEFEIPDLGSGSVTWGSGN